MHRSLVALWLSLIAAIVAIALLAFFWTRQRAENTQQRVGDILQAQLEPYREAVRSVLDGYSIALQRELSDADLEDLQACVELTRFPLSQAVVVVDPQQQLHFPRDANLSTERQALLDEALQLLREHAGQRPQGEVALSETARAEVSLSKQLGEEVSNELSNKFSSDFGKEVVKDDRQPAVTNYRARTYPAQAAGKAAAQTSQSAVSNQANPADAAAAIGLQANGDARDGNSAMPTAQLADVGREPFGWITWYHRRGMVLAFWWQPSDQWQCMVVLPRARWMADIVAALPASNPGTPSKWTLPSSSLSPAGGSLKQLIDVEGNLIYQWGDSLPADWDALAASAPDISLPLDDPLEGWRLRVFASPTLRASLAGDDVRLPLLLGVVGMSIALVLVGVLITVNLNRQIRLAAQRVSFVNQVSHELRTPLTNICMYADLIAHRLQAAESDDAQWAAKLQEDAAVIQSESQRLSRLIGNVLQFARPDSKPATLRLADCVVDNVVRDVLATFQPRLEQLGFKVVCQLATPELRQLDPDVLEQILVNLIGNAEKYAVSGKRLTLTTRAEGATLSIWVEDAGPGIPKRNAEKIFAPFVRLSDRLQDPAGTGIGLTIARHLARRHGGDCVLMETDSGATFRCQLIAELSQSTPTPATPS